MSKRLQGPGELQGRVTTVGTMDIQCGSRAEEWALGVGGGAQGTG